jgi:hypothetical protein
VRARVLTSISHGLKNGHGRIKWPYKTRAPASQLFPLLNLPFHFGFESRRLHSRIRGVNRGFATISQQISQLIKGLGLKFSLALTAAGPLKTCFVRRNRDEG